LTFDGHLESSVGSRQRVGMGMVRIERHRTTKNSTELIPKRQLICGSGAKAAWRTAKLDQYWYSYIGVLLLLISFDLF
jgi:hypothetical protein